MPIDDPHEVRTLLEALNATLPMQMMMGPDLRSLLKSEELKIDAAAPVVVEKLFYTGDEGGVLTGLRASGTENQLVVSITHLVPLADHPLAARIVGYQQHRVAAIALQNAQPRCSRASKKAKRKRR